MAQRLAGKVALITGGARGQGAAEARLFVEEGARVVISDVRTDDGEAVAKELGDVAVFFQHDVGSASDWAGAVAGATELFGGVDVLVNNAAVFRPTPIVSTTADEYMEIIRINQLGVFLGMQAVVAPMRAAGGGSVINVSSIGGVRGTPAYIAYSASKFAVTGMTKTAALELAPHWIRVNSLHPGVIDTPMLRETLADAGLAAAMSDARIGKQIPIGTASQPEDVARLALFLASDESRHCTGAEFFVDGGLTAGVGYVLG